MALFSRIVINRMKAAPVLEWGDRVSIFVTVSPEFEDQVDRIKREIQDGFKLQGVKVVHWLIYSMEGALMEPMVTAIFRGEAP